MADTLEDLGLGDLGGMGEEMGSGFNTAVMDKLGDLVPPTFEYEIGDSLDNIFGDGESWLSKMLAAILGIGSLVSMLAISNKNKNTILDSNK